MDDHEMIMDAYAAVFITFSTAPGRMQFTRAAHVSTTTGGRFLSTSSHAAGTASWDVQRNSGDGFLPAWNPVFTASTSQKSLMQVVYGCFIRGKEETYELPARTKV